MDFFVRIQSSAKRRNLDLADDGMSFMYNKNRTGPKIEPCGTQNKTGLDKDRTPFIETDWERFVTIIRIGPLIRTESAR